MTSVGWYSKSVLVVLSLLVFFILLNNKLNLFGSKANVHHENILCVLTHAKMTITDRNSLKNTLIDVFSLETR